MREHRTGAWTVVMDADGCVVDVWWLGLEDDVANRAAVVRALNDDLAGGFAPPDVATWGHEYKNHLPRQLDAFYWVSYLQTVWYGVKEQVALEVRRAQAKRLHEILNDLAASGLGRDRVRTGVFEQDR